LPPLIDQDRDLDWIGGSAGCLCALLGLSEVSASQDLLPLIDRCGEQLVAKAQPMTQGMGWSTVADTPPLSGFSHGGAGIILALLRLYDKTGDNAYLALAHQGLRYERSLFSPSDQNWANLLAEPGEDPYAVAWSHGASGIGLARLAGLPYLDTPTIRAEIQMAITITLSQGMGHNHSLCNGDFGHLDLLLQAQSFLTPVQQQTLDQRIVRVLAAMQQQQWRCGLPLNTQTPGLMMGLAGIGYGLLRLHSPDRIPCVLTLSFAKV
jgi:lantibiotic modifying enzyme